MTNLTKEARAALQAVKEVVTFGNAVKATGGSKESCAAYDAATAKENELYEAMNAAGMTRAQWAEYDRQSAVLYKNLNY
jgi:hypothetical protein|tara:strand:- start:65 stop:301 length:237 start_codon:yes stop_codon:yes gene_type:complete